MVDDLFVDLTCHLSHKLQMASRTKFLVKQANKKQPKKGSIWNRIKLSVFAASHGRNQRQK